MDFRKMKGTFTMLNDWVIEFFRPAVQIGLKKSAMVLNDDIFTRFATNDALSAINFLQLTYTGQRYSFSVNRLFP